MKKSDSPIINHIPDFLDWLDIERGLASLSQENYARFINKFTAWLASNKLSKLKPHELDGDHIWKYRIYLSRGSRSPTSGHNLKKSSQNYYLIALRSLLNFFAHRDILSLPAEKVRLIRDKADKDVKFLSLEQLEKLFLAPDIKTVKGLRDRAILQTFFSTGMRISELTALNVEQIKFKDVDEGLELSIIGKGSKVRTVYFSPSALRSLEPYLATRKDNLKPLFINYKRRAGASPRLTPRSIEKSIKYYVVKTGLPLTTTPHVMRHSFATNLLAQGVDLRIVQEFLGHRSIIATQIYAHVTSKQLKDIHKKYHGKN